MVCNCAEVRLAAVECCAKMLTPFVRVYEGFEGTNRTRRGDVLNLIQSVLRALVTVAVVDPCKFAYFLQNVNFLFDLSFSCRNTQWA